MRNSKEKNLKLDQREVSGVTWPTFLNLGRLELETSYLVCRLISGGTNEKKVVRKGSRGRLLKFWYPLYNSLLGTVGARNLKFGTQIDHQGHYRKNAVLICQTAVSM